MSSFAIASDLLAEKHTTMRAISAKLEYLYVNLSSVANALSFSLKTTVRGD
jgi:hypothetical protein